MKLNIFRPLRNLFRKRSNIPPDEQLAPESATGAAQRRIVTAPRSVAPPPPRRGLNQNGRGIELLVQPILATLPLELQPRLLQGDAGDQTLFIPLEKILAQLSRGLVQISFGELRQAVPSIFTSQNDLDRVMVPLPLSEILPQLNPALITRRRVQKQIEVPAEISSPFDQRNQGLIFSMGPAKPPTMPTPATALTPPRQTAVPAPPPAVPPARAGMTFAPVPMPHVAPPPAKPPAASPPVAPAISSSTLPPQPLPMRQAPAPAPAPVPTPAPAAPAPPPPKPAEDSNPILISLISLAEAWPEAIRKELVQLNLVEARVALPTELVERALKQGRIAFTWKTLRSWVKPTLLPTISAYDSTVLELPLKVVAPLFLARQTEGAKAHKKVAVDADIPNLLFGSPQPGSGGATVAPAPAVSAAAAKPQDTNFYVWDDASDRVRVQEDEIKRGPSPGTRFVAKYATPNEVVSRAAGLDGVAGSLIALPDGLMVANRLPPDVNGDTLAAFLPQIFAKVTQCTKELRMGELNNLNFTVGNVPWKIFRVNAIFFAAFGRAGEPLPTSQLAALAGELDHKPK